LRQNVRLEIMRILMVLDRVFPYDERVEKEALSLTKSGHEVHIACYSFGPTDVYSLYKGIHIHRRLIKQFIYKSGAACLIIPTYFKWWYTFLNTILTERSFNVIHVHDLPLSKVGYQLKKKYNLKLVCDQHEYYSSWIVHTSHYNRGVGKLVNRFSNWEKFEIKYLHRADLILTVSEPLRDIYTRHIGIPNEKVVTVPNTPDLSVFDKAARNSKTINKFNNRFILFYGGGIDTLRGLDLVLESLNILKKKIPEILFLVAGKEQKGFSIEALAQEKNVSKYVHFAGWLSMEDLASYMSMSHIGVFTPQLNREEIHCTIPTKIYQYCALGKPIITTKAKMMEEFILKYKVGMTVEDPEHFAQAVDYLYKNKKAYDEMSNNGISISEKYSWHITVSKLINAYKAFRN
jgi:glycosyltransferase involved in cell wall biosynthesis